MKYCLYTIAILTVCGSLSLASAQNKVVVVPLGGKKCASPAENSFTNSIGMTFNLIPAGTFTMGSPAGEPGREDDETQHQVTLTRSFYMQTTEVTQQQWNMAMVVIGGANPSGSNIGEDYPVERVNWFEAAAFANGLSLAEGLTPCYDGNGTCTGTMGVDFTCTEIIINASCTGYRLPTEAEWEYAARAGTTTAYANPVHFDETSTEIGAGFNTNLHAMGWYLFNNEMTSFADIPGYTYGTKPVAQKQSNRWGLYDMHGNVGEWCQDWYGIYSSQPVTDPQGPADGSNRVIRGASWQSFASSTRSAGRSTGWPNSRYANLGFRLVLPQGR